MSNITELLLGNKDVKYAEFSKKIIPDTKHQIIGVRTPKLKQIAKEIIKDKNAFFEFINEKHTYHEEFLLHGLLLGEYKENISELLAFLREFIPHIDNWAVCDLTVSALKIIKNYKTEVLELLLKLLSSSHPYSIRFAIVTLMWYYLDSEYFDRSVTLVYERLNSENYYINMSIAWFFCTAIIKDYNKAIGCLIDKKLPKFIHNKTIQKCIDSFRLPQQTKTFLKTLKI